MTSIFPRLVVTAVAIAVLGTSAQARPRNLELRRLVIGEKTSSDQVSRATKLPCRAQASDTLVCDGFLSIGEMAVAARFVIREGNLQRIDLSLPSEGYDAVYTELVARYGSPDDTIRQMFDYGVWGRMEQRQAVWEGPNGTQMYVVRFSSDMRHSSITYTTVSERALIRGPGLTQDSDR